MRDTTNKLIANSVNLIGYTVGGANIISSIINDSSKFNENPLNLIGYAFDNVKGELPVPFTGSRIKYDISNKIGNDSVVVEKNSLEFNSDDFEIAHSNEGIRFGVNPFKGKLGEFEIGTNDLSLSYLSPQIKTDYYNMQLGRNDSLATLQTSGKMRIDTDTPNNKGIRTEINIEVSTNHVRGAAERVALGVAVVAGLYGIPVLAGAAAGLEPLLDKVPPLTPLYRWVLE